VIARLLDAGFIKEMYQLDYLANQYLYQKRIKNEGCLLIVPISTKTAKKIRSASRESIKSWTPWQDASFLDF
jgi:hypothetical protein